MYSYLQMTEIMCKTPSARADYSLSSSNFRHLYGGGTLYSYERSSRATIWPSFFKFLKIQTEKYL